MAKAFKRGQSMGPRTKAPGQTIFLMAKGNSRKKMAIYTKENGSKEDCMATESSSNKRKKANLETHTKETGSTARSKAKESKPGVMGPDMKAAIMMTRSMAKARSIWETIQGIKANLIKELLKDLVNICGPVANSTMANGKIVRWKESVDYSGLMESST